MATGGHDTSKNGLDLSEVIEEISKLEKSIESDTKENLAWEDTLTWENSKADLAFDSIAAEETEKDFLGFPLTSTPTKKQSKSDKKYRSAPSSPIPSRRRSPESPESAKSTPVSPVSSRPTLSVLERVQSWERLSNTVTEVHSVTGARSKQ